MCTLVALHRCTPGASLWIAANRDEYLERPAEGPALRAGRGGLIVSPLDRRAGGTWWGLDADCLFVALTNRPTASLDPARRSRGQLVLDLLGTGSAREAARRAASLGPEHYNPFNLFLADGREAFAVVYDGRPALRPLAPGAHVIGNADPDARDVPKIRRILEEAERLAEAPPERIRDGLAALCREHGAAGDDPRSSPCVHLGGYGTRSSTLLRLGPAGALLEHADGPPCTSAYRDFTPLLLELGRTVPSDPGETATRKAS
jgi:uncharacterized protein with NRDE domain